MGYYIQGPALRKGNFLVKEYNAQQISRPLTFNPPKDKAYICVVDNGIFEAAAFCYNQREYEEFSLLSDKRNKEWYLMDLSLVKQLSGYTKDT